MRRTMSRMQNPAHPGEVLREYLPEDVTVTDVARRLGVTRQALSALLNGRAGVSADMALRLAQALRKCGCQCRWLMICGRPSKGRAPKSGASPRNLILPVYSGQNLKGRIRLSIKQA